MDYMVILTTATRSYHMSTTCTSVERYSEWLQGELISPERFFECEDNEFVRTSAIESFKIIKM